jgi:uncharacterized protein (TIGR02246 family)
MQTIRENIMQWDDAFNAGDVEGLMSLYATDAVRMEPDQPAWVGKSAIMRGFEGWFEQYDTEAKNTPEDIVIAGDWSIARISWTATITPKGDGEPIQNSGKAMTVSQRQSDGMWKFVWDIWNSDAPMPQSP